MNSFRPLYHMITGVPLLRDRAHRAAIGAEFRRWCASNPRPEFATRFDLYRSVIEAERLEGPIDYLAQYQRSCHEVPCGSVTRLN